MSPILLSPHFSLAEFTASETAARRGLPNSPTDTAIAHMRDLCEKILEPARLALGPLHVTSGYRAPLVNWYVRHPNAQPPVPLPDGGQHPKGEAADIVPTAVSLTDFLVYVHLNLPFDQLIWEFGSWVHVSYTAKQAPRAQTLLAARTGGGSVAYTTMTREQVLALAA